MQPADTRKTAPMFGPWNSFQDAQSRDGRAWKPNAVKMPLHAAHNVVLYGCHASTSGPPSPWARFRRWKDAPAPGLQLGALFPRG